MENRTAAWNEVIVRAWTDEDYMAQLLADPLPLLRDAGFEVPEDATVSVMVEASPNHRVLVIPAKPQAQIVDSAKSASDTMYTLMF